MRNDWYCVALLAGIILLLLSLQNGRETAAFIKNGNRKDDVSSYRSEWQVGHEVTAVYNPSDPRDTMLLNSFGHFGNAVALMCFAMPLIVLGSGIISQGC